MKVKSAKIKGAGPDSNTIVSAVLKKVLKEK